MGCAAIGPLRAQEGDGAQAAPKPDVVEAPLEVPVADGRLPLLVPRGESLEFTASLELLGVDVDVGRVTLDSGVKPYQAGLFARPSGAPSRETAWVRARARGEYGVYSMDSNIETLLQPQAWPSLVQQFEQKGTERRRREILIGVRDGVGRASYRSDTRTGAPAGTRIWRDAREFDALIGSLDTLGAVFLVRTMIRDGRDLAMVHLLDKERLWEVALTLCDPTTIDTHAGRFEAREVRLATRLISTAGVITDEDDTGEFTGPFGIRGNIRLYVERRTGVPLLVKGRLPAGPIDIDLRIELRAFKGTPAEFVTLAPGAVAPVSPPVEEPPVVEPPVTPPVLPPDDTAVTLKVRAGAR